MQYIMQMPPHNPNPYLQIFSIYVLTSSFLTTQHCSKFKPLRVVITKATTPLLNWHHTPSRANHNRPSNSNTSDTWNIDELLRTHLTLETLMNCYGFEDLICLPKLTDQSPSPTQRFIKPPLHYPCNPVP